MTRLKMVPLLIVLAFVALCALPFSAVPLGAQGLPQAESAATLRRAEGLVFDTTEFDPEPHWAFTGPFVLSCGPTPCVQADPSQIVFDLTLAMVRPDGGLSHAHSFSDFVGTSVEVDDDNFTLEGTIVGTGAVGGLTDIRVKIIAVSEASELRLELIDNSHIVGELGGVVTGSR